MTMMMIVYRKRGDCCGDIIREDEDKTAAQGSYKADG
jgi:hypothetical protein